jgi:hypothetical protein
MHVSRSSGVRRHHDVHHERRDERKEANSKESYAVLSRLNGRSSTADYRFAAGGRAGFVWGWAIAYAEAAEVMVGAAVMAVGAGIVMGLASFQASRMSCFSFKAAACSSASFDVCSQDSTPQPDRVGESEQGAARTRRKARGSVKPEGVPAMTRCFEIHRICCIVRSNSKPISDDPNIETHREVRGEREQEGGWKER